MTNDASTFWILAAHDAEYGHTVYVSLFQDGHVALTQNKANAMQFASKREAGRVALDLNRIHDVRGLDPFRPFPSGAIN